MKAIYFTLAALTCAFLVWVTPTHAQVTTTASQFITLEPGWNIVSTPRVLQSHTFSVAETAENFDVYLLDASQPTGWATMADLGQTTFTPLYGYFINNKTVTEQTLTLQFDATVEPNERFFQRSFSAPGWYSVGVANGEYAKQQEEHTIDTNNPSRILSLLEGKYDMVVDFTEAEYDSNPSSVALSDPWGAAAAVDIDNLNDLRETKGYAIYIKEPDARYNGLQSSATGTIDDVESGDALVNVTSGEQPDATYMTEGGVSFEFDIQPTDTSIVVDSIVLRVSTPGATTSEVIGDVNGDGVLMQDDGESALYAFDYDQRVAIAAGQKQGFFAWFDFSEDFVDSSNTQTIQVSIGPAEIAQWELYAGTSLVPTSEIDGEVISPMYTIFSYGVLLDDVHVDGSRTNESNIMEFEVEVDVDFVGHEFGTFDAPVNEEDNYEVEYEGLTADAQSSTNTVNGLTYRIDGPEGFSSVATVMVDVRKWQESANLEFHILVEASLPGEYTLTVEEIAFLDEAGNEVVAVIGEHIDAEDISATSYIINPIDSLGGVARLDEFNLFVAENPTVPIGVRDAVLAEAEPVFIDGDAKIDSVVVQFTNTPPSAQLWELLDAVTLWVDGDQVAEVPISSVDDFFGTNDDTVRFDDLNVIGWQDDELHMVIAADIASTASPAEVGEYEIQVSEFTYQDASETVITETQFDDIGQYGGVQFDVEPAIEELEFSLSANNPDPTTLIVEDNQDSDPYTIFVYDVGSGDSNVDITLEELAVTVVVGQSTYFDIVDEATLSVDGSNYKVTEIVGGDTDTAILRFELDESSIVEPGGTQEVELELVFNPLDSENEGVTVEALVTADNVMATKATGLDDLAPSQLVGAASGETHELLAVGLFIAADTVETDVTTSGENDTVGEFTIEFETVAIGSDFYIPESGVNFTVDGPVPATTTYIFDSTANEDSSGVFRIREGETEVFTLRVLADPSVSGQHRLTLHSLTFSDSPDGVTNEQVKSLSPEIIFRTSYQNINAN